MSIFHGVVGPGVSDQGVKMEPIYFIGAGPGDPELLTIKAQRILAMADRIVWAGSLVHPAILAMAKPEAELIDSSALSLEQIMAMLVGGYQKGLQVVRLHTGDPSIYGAIHEQISCLQDKGIPYRIIPGISSFLAAAAALGIEYTVPEITQTVILTRVEGRTPMPKGESLTELAKHQSSICIFLSMHLLERTIQDLISVLPPVTRIAVVEKVSWPEERIIHGTLRDIIPKIKEAGIERTALMIVGKCLEQTNQRSKLYDPLFEHGYRRITER